MKTGSFSGTSKDKIVQYREVKRKYREEREVVLSVDINRHTTLLYALVKICACIWVYVMS